MRETIPGERQPGSVSNNLLNAFSYPAKNKPEGQQKTLVMENGAKETPMREKKLGRRMNASITANHSGVVIVDSNPTSINLLRWS